MKLTAVLLLAACLQVHATGYAQKLTITGKDIPLEKVFQEIKEQAGYFFLYEARVLNTANRVTINVRNASLQQVLDLCFAGQPLEYRVIEKTILIKAKVTRKEFFAPVSGRILDAGGNPLAGATVVNKRSKAYSVTDADGRFTIAAEPGDVLVVSFIGYESREISIDGHVALGITLLRAEKALDTAVLVSTGYQTLPKERATGSFVQVGNDLVNRKVSGDIISRLTDVVPGMIFNRGSVKPGSQTNISIRGESTIFAKADPLIVLDNFPYPGDINTINPNDIESITVLKDAAAASIWGAQSGNGVIVLTTRKGRYDKPATLSFNSNVSLTASPDAFYFPKMTSSEYIDMEKVLFKKGHYKATETSPRKLPLTPVVELLIAQRDGQITEEEATARIDAYRDIDFRNDVNKYLYRNGVSQQYALSLRGGSRFQKYFVSAGYDKSKKPDVGNSSDRVTLNVNNTFSALKGKLEFNSSVYYTSLINRENSIGLGTFYYGPTQPAYSYASMTDENGNPASMVYQLRSSFLTKAAADGLLDWSFRPLDEIRLKDIRNNTAEYRINAGLSYRILPVLQAQASYQFSNSINNAYRRQSKDSWEVRNMINTFTIVSPTGLIRPVPLGDILDRTAGSVKGHFARFQLNYDQRFGDKHLVTILAGTEVRDVATTSYSNRVYGYDPELGTSTPVDYISFFTSYVNPASTTNKITEGTYAANKTDRFISYYTNAAYSFDDRYLISGSARVDKSNLFGVRTNQKQVPLYSAGLAWNIHKEGFYRSKTISYLKLRTTYGYNGNIDKTLSAYATAVYFSPSSWTGLPFSRIKDGPNPELRWERIRMINFGLDFKMLNNRVSGSIEYYLKKGVDLLGDAPLAGQTGLTIFRGNTANIKGQGMDLVLNTLNVKGLLQWETQLFVSYAANEVTQYLRNPTSVYGDHFSGSPVPKEGRPIHALYSYAWAGLDPANGDPQGYVNGAISKDYGAIVEPARAGDLVYHGFSRPVVYGSMRNNFSYKGFSVSVNLSFRAGYYFRRPSVEYGTVLSGNGGHADYRLRWQKPGDEQFTQVLSLPVAINRNRETFYKFSSVLVERGDHVRLQDIRISYSLGRGKGFKLPLQNAEVYLFADNLGIIWKKYKGDLDPDFMEFTQPPLRTISIGIRGDL